MGVECGLPEFGLFGELIGFDEFEDFDKMRGDGVIERVVFRGNFEVGIPTFECDVLVVMSEVEFIEGLGKSVRVSLSIILMDLCEEDLDGFGRAVVGILALHRVIMRWAEGIEMVDKRWRMIVFIVLELLLYVCAYKMIGLALIKLINRVNQSIYEYEYYEI